MRSRQLWQLLFGAPLLVAGLVIGASAPATAESGGCVGDVVVALDVRVLARPGQDLYEIPFSEPLPPGVWSVQVISHDAYEGRSATNQTQEQWELTLWDHGTLGPTTDIPDGVEAASVVDDLGTVTSVTGIAGVTVSHAVPSTPWGAQSVAADCVGFTLLESPPQSVVASVRVECSIPGIEVSVVNNGGIRASVEVELESPPFTEIEFWLDPGQMRRVDLVVPNGDYELEVEVNEVHVHESVQRVACGSDPSPGPEPGPAPDPVPLPDPGPDPGPLPGPVPVPDPTPGPDSGGVPRPVPLPRLVPSLAVSLDCSSSTIDVRVANTGLLSGAADLVLVRTGIVEAFELAAKSSMRLSVGLPADAEGSTLELLLVSSDAHVLSAEVPVDCLDPAQPAATLRTICTSNSVEVRVVNRGGEAIGIDVFVEQLSLVAERTVAAGGETTIIVPFGAAARIPVRVVTVNGVDLLRRTIEADCPRALIEANLAVSCPSGEIQVTVRNTGDADGVARLVLDGGEPYGVTPAPGEEIILARRVDIGSTTRVSVVDGFDVVVLDEVIEAWSCEQDSEANPSGSNPCPSGLSDSTGWTALAAGSLPAVPCPGLSVRLVVDCVSNTVALVGSNASPDARRLIVTLGGTEVGGDFLLQAGDQATWKLADAVGQQVVVTERDAAEALVDVIARCDGGGVPARVAGVLIVLISLVTVGVAKFDPSSRV